MIAKQIDPDGVLKNGSTLVRQWRGHTHTVFIREDGFERTSAFLELCRQSPKAALQCAARAPMGALLQLVGEPPDDQIATEAQGRSGVMQCPPGTPQLLCRPIDQPANFAIKPRQVRASQTVVSAAAFDRDPRTARHSAGEPMQRG